MELERDYKKMKRVKKISKSSIKKLIEFLKELEDKKQINKNGK